MSTTTVLETSTAKSEGAFLESLPPKHLAPLWTEMAKMVPPRPNPSATTAVWKYKDAKPLLMEAGEIVDAEEAERRVLMLVNPAMGNTTNSSMILL
jgi:gentisate 1,2-dioxygenase